MNLKTCRKCLITKPVGDFSPSKTVSDGRKSWCRKCCQKATNNETAAIYAEDRQFKKGYRRATNR